jgi:beta-fructofuranosidase
MDYSARPKYHYKPKKGWINDPNGLVYFDGYYHLFYQHCPDCEANTQPVHWGHARTKDFLNWEELPIALYPDKEYDKDGCWSGTATVKDGVLYLFYASVVFHGSDKNRSETVSVAYSKDGIHFEKYKGNPVVREAPPEGGMDFRDPAVCRDNDDFYLVMATGNPADRAARLLLYKSKDLLTWDYRGIMAEWAEHKYAECPSFMRAKDGYLLTTSTCTLDDKLKFRIMYGDLKNDVFTPTHAASVDKGPDQYAGQVFCDSEGRTILISWMPGWRYVRYKDHDVGCMTVPREITLKDGVIRAYPVKEVQHLLKDTDPALVRTDKGFTVERCGRTPFVYEGEIFDLKLIRDEYVMEIFVNGGEEVFTVLL